MIGIPEIQIVGGEKMITVIGSLNVDLNIKLDHFVNKGETIASQSMTTTFGGKGGNQAVAAARLGAEVSFVGAVGDDAYGQAYLDTLAHEKIDVTAIQKVKNVPTGTAVVMLSDTDNAIIVVSGANGEFSKDDVQKSADAIKRSAWIIVQFEISNETIEQILNLAKLYQVPVILNPAPFRVFPQAWIDKIAFITPNETEYMALCESGLEVPLDKLIVTQGSKGVKIVQDGKTIQIVPPKVKVVDTTGAGDTFNGALAVALEYGKTLEDACRFAVVAASLSTEQFSAQAGMPSLQQVKEKISEGYL